MDVIKNIPFSPAITGGLLYTLTRAPEQLKAPALDHLKKYLSPKSIRRTITTLKWLFALGLARNFHIWLSDIAQNNFRLRSERHRYDWPSEVAVVTGGASGFGALIAKGLAAKGLTVVALDLGDDLPEDMKVNRIHYYKCDITNRQLVLDTAQKIRQEHGEVSVLINNAGVAFSGNILDVTEKSLNQVFNVNIISHYWTLQAFLPDMIKNRKGHVVGLASMASFLGGVGLIPYCNTKAAVLSLHEGLQAELRTVYKCPEIKFSIVHPTYAATPMTASHRAELAAAGATVIDPQIVADAVVKQIMSGKGAQIILGAESSFAAGMRGWPHWLAQALVHSMDGKTDLLKDRRGERPGA